MPRPRVVGSVRSGLDVSAARLSGDGPRRDFSHLLVSNRRYASGTRLIGQPVKALVNKAPAPLSNRILMTRSNAAVFLIVAVHCAGLAVAVAAFAVALARLRRLDLVGQVLCAGGDSRPQSAGPDAWALRARLAVRSHEASSRPASACSRAMRVSSTRDLMSSLRNTWRRWNATVCVLMNS
jgi:hypothetical protein